MKQSDIEDHIEAMRIQSQEVLELLESGNYDEALKLIEDIELTLNEFREFINDKLSKEKSDV